jgi:hypothetical protein
MRQIHRQPSMSSHWGGGLPLPKELTSPSNKEDHPELDITKELPVKGIQHYQSIVFFSVPYNGPYPLDAIIVTAQP